jgi:hypothetical protein
VADLGLWITAVGLSLEFKTFTDNIENNIKSLNVAQMTLQMFELYVDMRNTINGA